MFFIASSIPVVVALTGGEPGSAAARRDDLGAILAMVETNAASEEGIVLHYTDMRGRNAVLIAYHGGTEAFLFATPTAVILRDERGIVFMRTEPHGALREFIPKTGGEFPGDAQMDDFFVTPAVRSMLKTRAFDRVAERPGGGWIVTRPYSKRSREGPLSAPQVPESDAPISEWHLGPTGMPLRCVTEKGRRVLDYQYSDKCDDVWWFVEQTSSPVPNSGHRLVSARKLERNELKYFDPKLAVQVVEDEVVRPANTRVIHRPEKDGGEQVPSTGSRNGLRGGGISGYIAWLAAAMGAVGAWAVWRWRRVGR